MLHFAVLWHEALSRLCEVVRCSAVQVACCLSIRPGMMTGMRGNPWPVTCSLLLCLPTVFLPSTAWVFPTFLPQGNYCSEKVHPLLSANRSIL